MAKIFGKWKTYSIWRMGIYWSRLQISHDSCNASNGLSKSLFHELASISSAFNLVLLG